MWVNFCLFRDYDEEKEWNNDKEERYFFGESEDEEDERVNRDHYTGIQDYWLLCDIILVICSSFSFATYKKLEWSFMAFLLGWSVSGAVFLAALGDGLALVVADEHFLEIGQTNALSL